MSTYGQAKIFGWEATRQGSDRGKDMKEEASVPLGADMHDNVENLRKPRRMRWFLIKVDGVDPRWCELPLSPTTTQKKITNIINIINAVLGSILLRQFGRLCAGLSQDTEAQSICAQNSEPCRHQSEWRDGWLVPQAEQRVPKRAFSQPERSLEAE